MLFKNISVLVKDEILNNMFVGVKGCRITHLSTAAPKEDFSEVYDGTDKLLMPGLCNTHMHVPMSLMRGYAEDLPLHEWLHQKVFPFEDQLDDMAVYYGSMLGIAEMIRFGTTSFSDMYFFSDNTAKAVIESGIKCNLSTGVVAIGEGLHFSDTKNYENIKKWYSEFNNSGNGRLKIDLSIHGEYTSNPDVVSEVSALCREYGAILHIHLSETELEHTGCLERWGKTPAKYFYDLGAFDNKTIAAHCVHITEDDMELMAEKGVSAVHCPVSNLKLASGIANVPQMMLKGVNVALGTDGVASNNNGNLFEELKLLSILHKENSKDPTAITTAQALAIATANGFVAQGREGGTIELGGVADLIVLDLHQPHLYPQHNLKNNVVFSALGSDVVLNMVDGKVLYRDGQYTTIDIEKVMAEGQRIAKSIASNVL